MKTRGLSILGGTLAVGMTLGAFACGSGDEVDAGHWAGGNASPGPTTPAPAQSGQTVSIPYPTTDPDPNGGPHGGPIFDGDGGAPEGGVRPSCSGKEPASGDTTITMMSAGGARDAIVHVPPGYDPTLGAPVVLSFHGYTSNAPEQELLTRMNETADARGVIVVYPDGVANSWNAGECCGTAWTNSVDDVQFVRDLVTRLSNDYCVDPARVYATGFSNGGFFSHRLACELSDVIAAVAPVSGTLGVPPETCKPARAVPVLEFHGTADPVVPYQGGTAASGFGGPVVFRSAPTSVAFWRTTDGCLAGTPQTIYAKGDTSCLRWGAGRDGSEVVFCTIDQGGHTWAGGVPIPAVGKTSTDISASDTIVDFFLAHPMPSSSL